MVQLTLAQIKVRYAYSETFTMHEGLEHNVVGDIQTDQNDLLWLSISGKLQLFDGDQFVDMNHLVHTSNAAGTFGFEHGKDVFFLKEHILYKFTPAQYSAQNAPSLTLPTYTRRDPYAKIIYEDCDFLYIAHPNDSLYQVEKKSLTSTHVYTLPHRPHKSYRWSAIYISPKPVSAITYFDTSFLRCTFDLKTGITNVDHACPDAWRGAIASGDSMLVLTTNTLDIYTRDRKHSIVLPEPGRQFNGQQFLLVGRDSVYVPLKDGIYLFNLRTLTWVSKIQRTEGLPFENLGGVRSIVLAKTGHIFFTTFNSGLVKLYPSNDGFQYLGVQGKKKYFIKCIRVSEKNNMVLAGTIQDGLLVFDTNGIIKHHIRQFPDINNLNLISSILKISDSRYILFANKTLELVFNGEGYRLTELEDSIRKRFTYYDNAIEDEIHQRYFIFNHRELIEIKPDDPNPVVSVKVPFFGSSIAATKSGDEYVVSELDELHFYNQDLKRHSIKLNVPNFGYSRCMVPYKPGQFLVATDLGIFLLDTLNPTALPTAIYNHMVYAILPGETEGEFWFSTDYGLYRLDADLHYQQYAIESGLQESEFNTNSCYKSESGKLYFGGINGITAFYPSQIEEVKDKPLPYISVLSVNGNVRERYIAPGASAGLTLGYTENVIQLRLLAKGLRSPRSYNFQYKVAGLHEEWINLGPNMDIQLQLNPGRYTIYYHIAESFEPNAEARYSLQLHIKPPLYQRWWFVLILSMVPLYFLYYIMNIRRKRQALKLAYTQELEHKLYEDRLRISRDLHDNIGAQMATVKRGINFILDQGDQLTDAQTTNKMRDLETISTQINQELRDTIWAVQQEQIDMAGFITRLKNYIFQVIGPDSLYRVVYEEHGDKQLILGPFVALNLHRICQEAFNNILKHAEATEIRIFIDSGQSSLKIQI
ncbi:MAG: hypothetical protein KBA14_08005, partial [Saprospiraceae bacterium]|nr:hypothetical protein [Saprospiraceae bacterium]